jgi:glycosyltransferase involved in cell wall biosynthesis
MVFSERATPSSLRQFPKRVKLSGLSQPLGRGVLRNSRQSMEPFVSVIIPVYNDAARLTKCLAALQEQTYPRNKFEVIVVDNGSTDEISSVGTMFPSVKFLKETREGSYAARNKGVLACCGDVIAFTDADCIPSKAWLENGCKALQNHPGCGLVGGGVELFAKDPANPNAVEIYESLFEFRQKLYIEKYNCAATANVITYRKVFQHVGLFDENLKSSGDEMWGRRVCKMGYKAIYCGDAMVRHPARRTLVDIGKKHARLAGGVYLICQKHRRLAGRMCQFAVEPLIRCLAVDSEGKTRLSVLGKSRERIKALWIATFLSIVRLFESMRLLAGGEPKR